MQNGCGTWKEYPQIEYFSHSNWGLFQHIHHLKAATFPRLAEVQVLLRCQLGIAPEPQTWHHLLHPCEISGCSIWGIRGLSGRCCPARKHPRGPSAKAGPCSSACLQGMHVEPRTHPVVQLDDEVISSLVAPKLEVHDSVYTQLLHADQSSGFQMLTALPRAENICQTMQRALLVMFYAEIYLLVF